jgi:hypothetical protein
MATYFWVGGTGTWDASSTTNWSLTSGGLPGIAAPNNTDTVVFDSASGTGTCTTAAGSACAVATLNSSTLGLTLGANHTMSGTFTFTLGTLSLNNNTLTCNVFSSNNSNARVIDFGTGNITLTGNGATIWSCATVTNFSYVGTPTVNLTYAGSTGTRGVSHGSVAGATEANSLNFNVTAGTDTFSISSAAGSSVRNLNFTGFAGTFSATIRNIYGDLTLVPAMTLTAGNGTTTFRKTSGTQQITTAGLTLDYPIAFNGIGGIFAFQDAVTQASTRAFTITNGTVQLKNGVTSTVGSFVANNSNVKFLQSTTSGSQATLSQSSGTVNVVDLTIRDINAVGGADWNAYTDFENTDAGNNDGWNFSLSPPYSTAEFPITLRSFTQPRRF